MKSVNNMLDVPEYIIMSYPLKTDLLMSAILFTSYCTKTVFSVLICHSTV